MIYKRRNIILLNILILSYISVDVLAKEFYFSSFRDDNESEACNEVITNIFRQIIIKRYKMKNFCDSNIKGK